MTKQTVNIGTTANDGTGDPARTAFDKLNDNFNEVYGVNGILKSNGSTTLSAAAEGTDYYGPGGTDVAVADGGTGASTAADARTALGLAIGSDVQAWDADLDTWATKTPPSGAIVGTTDAQTLTNKTLTTPAIAQINDANGNEALTLAATASAVNYLEAVNAATGNDVSLDAKGGDTNIGIALTPKGTGNITLGTLAFDADQSVGATEDNFVLTYDDATGLISLEAASGGGGSPGGSDGQVQYNNAGAFGGANVWVEDANTLALRNGVNPQTFRVANTDDNAGNFERGTMSFSGGALQIGSERGGTGGNVAVNIIKEGELYLELGSGIVSYKAFYPSNNNNQDLGISIRRWKDFYQDGFHQMSEMTAPSAPGTDLVRIFAQDNGAGKTELMALFQSGAAQQIAIEP